MGINSTKGITDESKMEIFRHSIYITQGFLIVLFNGIIIATIIRHDALCHRKEYTILGAQALADALSGLGTLTAGIYQIPVWLTQQDMAPGSRRFCLLTPHNFLWSWFIPAQHAMLTIVSVDRVLSLAIPTKYLGFSRRYALGMVSIPYGLTLVGAIVVYVMNWSYIEPIHTKVCWSSYAYGMTVNKIWYDGQPSVASFISVLIYMVMPFLYEKHTQVGHSGTTTSMGNSNNNMKFQKQLNKTVSVSCMFTFLFVCCPFLVDLCIGSVVQTAEEYEQVAVWMAIVLKLNPIVNLFVYIHKQTCFKVGVKALFKNKTLSPNVRNWPSTL